jgi:hypothetical protein
LPVAKPRTLDEWLRRKVDQDRARLRKRLEPVADDLLHKDGPALEKIVDGLEALIGQIGFWSLCTSVPNFDPASWRIPDDLPPWKPARDLLTQFADSLTEAERLAEEIFEREPRDGAQGDPRALGNSTAQYALLEQSTDINAVNDALWEGLPLLAEMARAAARLGPTKKDATKRGGTRVTRAAELRAQAADECATFYREKLGRSVDDGGKAFRRIGDKVVANSEFGDLLCAVFEIMFGDRSPATAQRAWTRAGGTLETRTPRPRKKRSGRHARMKRAGR